jgi:pimeloyl-ACP methyl ester carboxylesterase
MTSLSARPFLQAAEVAGRSVKRDLLERGDDVWHALARRRHPPATTVSWHVVNLDLDGRTLRYRVTDNEDATVWAINVHGYFAGGSMYARESEILAERLGWRMVNPSLPGFGGSGALPDNDVTIGALSDHIELVRAHLGIERFVLLGHSMGGAVAIDYATRHPERVLGVIYRDGVATPEWQERHGWPARLVHPLWPELASVVDLMSAVVLDAPDLVVGHLVRTVGSLLPDLHANVRALASAGPVARMLMHLDLTTDVTAVAARVPIYAIWGCFDRVVTSPAAESFARAARLEVQWVPGGHLWMLARPAVQADLLTENRSGTEFVDAVERRLRDEEVPV